MAFYGGLRGTWSAFIQSGVKRGLTSAQTLRAGRLAGLPTYRRTDYLSDYREAAQVPRRAPAIKAVRRDYLPSRSIYGKAGTNQTRSYRYQIRINIYKPDLKESYHITTNVVSDFQMTPNQVYEEALPPVNESVIGSDFNITDYTVEAAFAKDDAEW